MIKKLLPVGFLLLNIVLLAQNALPYGEWKTHFSYRTGHYVTQSPDKVYFATQYSIVEYDKEELYPRFISESEGLSETGIQNIKYIDGREALMIVYDNGLIDLYDDNEVLPMAQIKNFSNISLGKNVNKIDVANDSIVYLSASYGISKVNVNKLEFEWSTFTGINVNDSAIFDGYLWIATSEGIYRISTNNLFPEIFTNWEYIGSEFGFPDDYSAHSLEAYNNHLYCDINNDLYRYNDQGLTLVQAVDHPERHLSFLTSEGDFLVAGFGYPCTNNTNCGVAIVYAIDNNDNKKQLSTECTGGITNAIEDQQGRFWFATAWEGFKYLNHIDDYFCNIQRFNSPWSNKAWALDFADDQLWGAAGGYDATRSPTFVDHGLFSKSKEGQWDIYNRWTFEPMKGNNTSDDYRHDDLFDLLAVKVVTEKNKVYGGSLLEGAVEIDLTTQEAVIYNEQNSSLQIDLSDGGSEPRCRIGGIAYEKDKGSVWFSNPGAEVPLSELKADGTWAAHGGDFNRNRLFDIVIDDLNNKWLEVGTLETGLIVYKEADDNGNPAQKRSFTTSNSVLSTNEVLCIEKDLNGDIWVGTTDGIIIFERGADVFDSNYRGTRRIVEGDDGIAGYLLETESVQSIATDGANRKWIGTSNRLYLLSEDGKERIAEFTAENSDLPSDNILDIVIDGKTGEVFFATTAGLVSYQSDATQGTKVHQNNVVVYPNPVRPNYDGEVFIKGLSEGATVKITDISGNLVYETKALGGQAKWNGNNYKGHRASSGTYLVFSTDKSSFISTATTTTAVAKIVFIN